MAKADALPRRDKELTPRRNTEAYDEMVRAFSAIMRGFQDQERRADDIADYWDIYNCVLNSHQFYNGDSDIYVPIVYNAVEARTTRFLNQLFPQSGRYIDATSVDGGVPHAIVAVLETYIQNMRLRTLSMEQLLTNGDIEGHYHLYVDWDRQERHIVSRETRPARVALHGMGEPVDMDGEEVEDLVTETIIDASPCVEVLHDSDVLVLPVTAKSIENALRQGGSVTVIRRWTKETMEDMIERGEVMKKPAKLLLEMSRRDDFTRNTVAGPLDAAGIKSQGKIFQVYETWRVAETDEGRRLTKSLYGGHETILTSKRNPFWNDLCPLLSVPQKAQTGSFKGASIIGKGVDSLQYHANQVAQQGADSLTRGMLPIIMTDPAKNPRVSTMILNLGAIWEVDPASTRFAEFPPAWQHAIPIIQSNTQQVFQTMGVNPAMLPQQTGRPGAKRNQAETALEQTVDLLTTAKSCSILEEGILTPFLGRSVDYDHQFRDDDMMVSMFGEMGLIAKMESVPPQQTRHRYQFLWFGVEQARNAQANQQLIAGLNVARPFAQDLQKAGYRLNPAPLIEHMFGNLAGWRIGRQVLIDMRAQQTMDPLIENTMLAQGFDVAVHPLDKDPEHLKAHTMAMQAEGDHTGMFNQHIQRHMQSMQMKAMAMLQQQMQQPGQAQGPGGGGPQPGGQPAGPKLVRGPAGAIHPDQMPRAGAVGMPRKT